MAPTYGTLGFLLVLCVCVIDGQVVTAPGLGTLLGTTTNTIWTSKQINQFLGIRYGAAPSGSNRFKESIPTPPTLETIVTQKYGRPCPVLPTIPPGVEGDIEDCLFLSVFSGDLNASHPVILFIHGGGFIYGNTEIYSPRYLLEKDIVLVVPHFRLGPLGFMSTQTKDIAGNAGLSDVVLALQWTKRFISHFGGDPSRVTLYGHSSGSIMVSSLLFSPGVPSDLFHRVIMESGSSFASWGFDSHPERHAIDVARLGGCETNATIDKINECLIKMDAMILLKAYHQHVDNGHKVNLFNANGGNKLTFGGEANYLLPESTADYMRKNGARKNIPLMAGITKNEGTLPLKMIFDYIDTSVFNDPNYNTLHTIDKVIDYLGMEDNTGFIGGYMKQKLFTHEQLMKGNLTEFFPGLIDISGTYCDKAPMFKAIQFQSETYPNQTYLYSFDYKGEHTRFDQEKYPFDGGIHHGDDLMYIFPNPEYGDKLNETDLKIAKRMVSLWTSFAATGVPKAEDVPNWPTFDKKFGPYLHIDNECTLGENFVEEFTVTIRDAQPNTACGSMSFIKLIIAMIVVLLKI